MSQSFFKWKEEYKTGIQEIDTQHQMLVKLLNELYDAFMIHEHEKRIGDIISGLTDYALMHFKTEEKYFTFFKYEFKHEHIMEHMGFTDKVESFRNDYLKGNSVLTYKIINFLRDWLTNHIMISDRKYIACFKENGL